jgi:hypothetical protein
MGAVEIEKLFVLSVIDVEGYATAVGESAVHAEELENFGATSDGRWLRSCNPGTGKKSNSARADSASPW